jgi:uncharacterized SAM-binding protein YcdF (DUF218 family)
MYNSRYDAIILLGGGVNLDGSVDASAKERLERASQIYKQGNIQAIVVCGSYGYKGIEKPLLSEAQVYANYLESLGVPSGSIHLETKSQETLGNLLFAKMQIIMQHKWRSLLVIPTQNQMTERIDYLLKKIFGNDYSYDILRVGENMEQSNLEREAKALKHTKDINDIFQDGDHEAIYKGLMETHPAYGGTKWTVDELRRELG